MEILQLLVPFHSTGVLRIVFLSVPLCGFISEPGTLWQGCHSEAAWNRTDSRTPPDVACPGRIEMSSSISSMVWLQTHLLGADWISDARPHPNTSQLIRDKQAEPSGTTHTPGRWAGLQPCSQAGICTPAELAFPFLLSCIDLRKN